MPSYTTAAPLEAEALDLLAKIAADGPTSRLYKKLVVEEKVASSAAAATWGPASTAANSRSTPFLTDGVDLGKLEAAMDEVLTEIASNGVTQAELDRAKNGYVAEYIYENDNQASLARRYGWGLALGRSIAQIEGWPEEIRKVTIDDVKKVAAAYIDARRSVTGILKPLKAPVRRGDAFEVAFVMCPSGEPPHDHAARIAELQAPHARAQPTAQRRIPSRLRAAVAVGRAALPCIQQASRSDANSIRKKPRGIEAWLVEDHSNPMMALRFSFEGGSAQDPAGKEGLANFVSSMLDEGAGDLDAAAFQEKLKNSQSVSASPIRRTLFTATSKH